MIVNLPKIALALALMLVQTSYCVAGDSPHVLSLPDAVQLALARDALVRDAQQSLDNARARLVQASALTPTLTTSANSSAASSAGLDPESIISGTDYSSQSYYSSVNVPMRGGANLSLSSSASTTTTNSELRTGEGMEFTYAGASVGAGVSRPLSIFRDERVLTEGPRWSADISVRRAELALEEARRRVVGDTLAAFFGALRARRQAEIAAASQREATELLRIAKSKLDRGKLAEIEVMEARVSADSAGVALRRAESSAATALDALKNFLGMGLEQAVQLNHDETGTANALSPDEAALVERAIAQRADLQQLRWGIRSAELSVRQVEAESRPGASLGAGYTRTGQAETIGESFHQLVNPSWYVGLLFTTSLTQREDRAAIEQARGSLRLARMNEELRRDEVRLEIRHLLREVRDAAANAAQLAETVRIAEENLRIRQVQFDHGLIRPIDVTQTERQLTEARAQLLDAVIDHELSAAQLSLAAGEMPAVVTHETVQ
ncbi:MAG: TolC family protein [Armatimonadota bacterium]|nr:MAG: TolC family protein [Armatimonadota bacterium]